MQLSNKHQLQRREGDAIHISGDYQARALKSDRAVQRFWHEAKFRLIERVARPGKQDRVLDAGCGSGTISHFLSLHAGQVIGMDSNPSAISYASTAYDVPNLQFRLGQFEDLVGDKPFNRIYCIEVVEHLYEHQVAEVLSLFHKMTSPGGQLFLTTPNYQSAWPLIEWLLDRFALAAQMDEVQHVTHFTKRKLAATTARLPRHRHPCTERRMQTVALIPYARKCIGNRQLVQRSLPVTPQEYSVGLHAAGRGWQPRHYLVRHRALCWFCRSRAALAQLMQAAIPAPGL